MTTAPQTPTTDAAPIRLGVIGIDSSHLPEFTRRIHAMRDAGATRCTVAHYWTDGRHDMDPADVEGWRQKAEAMGVQRSDDLSAMLDAVDGVLVLSVNGNRHLAHALPALERGLPTYVDKPLTCDLAEARHLMKAARDCGARCYSASSLRFAAEVKALDRAALGDLVAVDATGPGELNASMKGLFFYGVHTVEMADAIWGPGVARVSAVTTDGRDLVRLEYRDGRLASLRLERRGNYVFAATVQGTKGLTSFQVDFKDVYTRLVEGMVGFFEGRDAPVPLERIVENVAVMEAGNASIAKGGEWVEVEAV